MTEYFNDVVVPATWGALVAAEAYNALTGTEPDNAIPALGTKGLRFQGTIQAKDTNTAVVEIRGLQHTGVKSGLLGSAGEYFEVKQWMDLSQIQVQGSGGTQVLKLFGVVDDAI